MTFYNIIFGIIFLAACRQLVVLSNTTYFGLAAIVALIIFNDAVNTSQIIESKGNNGRIVEYTLGMKLIDLANFAVLYLALIMLSPSSNPFGFVPPPVFFAWAKPWAIWLLLTGYWVLQICWNMLGRQFEGPWRKSRAMKWSLGLCAAFPIMLALSLMAGLSHIATYIYVALQIALLAALVMYSFVVRAESSGTATVQIPK